MLTAYLTRTRQLLQNPLADEALYSTSDLTSYINSARGQLSSETESIRYYAAVPLPMGARSVPFTAVTFPSTAGISGIVAIRGVTFTIADGQAWLLPRAFPWFQTYYLGNPLANVGAPAVYSQFGQGAAGTLYVDPVPDMDYTLNLDAVCFSADLTTDTSPEAIPYPYTDAVPYYAAYLALATAQRLADSEAMWQQYQRFAQRARLFSNSAVNPQQYPQSRNPVRAGQLGAGAQGGGQ